MIKYFKQQEQWNRFTEAIKEGSTFDLQNELCPRCEGTGVIIANPLPRDLKNKMAES